MDQTFKLLIIEDDSAVAQSLQDGLEHEGYTVTWKSSGQEGVQFAREHNPHLIVLDVRTAAQIPYYFGANLVRTVVKRGKVVV